MKKSRSSRKSNKPPSASRAAAHTRPKPRWSVDRTLTPVYSAPPRRYYQLDTLTNALDGELDAGNAFFFAIATKEMHSRRLAALHGALSFENDAILEFNLTFTAASRKKARLRLVVAKNDGELAEVVTAQFDILKSLAKRLPKHVPTPLKQGRIFLPDRHRRRNLDRQLPAYVTRPLPKAAPCAITKTGQFTIGHPQPKLLSQNDSEALKRRLLELCFRSYHAPDGSAMPPPRLDQGALRLITHANARPEPIVAECRTLWTGLTTTSLLHRVTGFDWTAQGVPVPLLPRDPGLLSQALINALGKDDAIRWLTAYRDTLDRGDLTEHHRLPASTIAQLVEALAG